MLVPVLAVTVLLGFTDSDWAHPGYVETVIHFGVALIGVRAAAGTTTEPAPSVDAEPDNHRVLDPADGAPQVTRPPSEARPAVRFAERSTCGTRQPY